MTIRLLRTTEMTPVVPQILTKARVRNFASARLVPSVLNDSGLNGAITLGVSRSTLTGIPSRALSSLRSKYPDTGLHIQPALTGIKRQTKDMADA